MANTWEDLTAEELEYVMDQGLEKLAELSEEDEGDVAEEFSKVAAALDLTPEELGFVIENGFDKVAAIGDVWNKAKEQGSKAATSAKDAIGNLSTRVSNLGKSGINRWKALPRGAQIGIGAAPLVVGAGALALRARKGRDNATMKTADVDWDQVADEDVEALLELGLQKIAFGPGMAASGEAQRLGAERSGAAGSAREARRAKAKLLDRIKGSLGTTKGKALAGLGAAAAVGGGALVASKLRGREKAASVEDEELSAEELEYIFQQGLEKIAEDQQGQEDEPSPSDIVRAALGLV